MKQVIFRVVKKNDEEVFVEYFESDKKMINVYCQEKMIFTVSNNKALIDTLVKAYIVLLKK